MWICKECHEKDKEIIGCQKPPTQHKNIAHGQCDICGKVVEEGFTCELYEVYIIEKTAN